MAIRVGNIAIFWGAGFRVLGVKGFRLEKRRSFGGVKGFRFESRHKVLQPQRYPRYRWFPTKLV